MRAQSSYSVREVADLAKASESKVRRLIDDGQLIVVADSHPRRVTAASVHEYLRRLIDGGPQLPDGVARMPDPDPDLAAVDGAAEAADEKRVRELQQTVRTLEVKIQDLEEDNERFRNTIQALRQSGAILLDDLGAYTSPKIPNN